MKKLILFLFIFTSFNFQILAQTCGGPCGGFTNTSASVCVGSNLTFTTSYSSGVSWSTTSNLSILTSSSGSITVQGTSAGTGTLCMSYNASGTICSVCKTITITGAPGASISNFVPANDLSYVKINASPASSSLYYTWFIDDVQYGSELLGGMQLAYPANCSQIYKVRVNIRNSCGTSLGACRSFSLNCTTGVVTTYNACATGESITSGDINLTTTAIYPNPTKQEIQIDFPSSGERNLSLIDASGSEVVSKKSTTINDKINLTGLRKGMYILKIQDGDKTETRRITIE